MSCHLNQTLGLFLQVTFAMLPFQQQTQRILFHVYICVANCVMRYGSFTDKMRSDALAPF